MHLRTTNPIESTFATVRHRTSRTKNCVSRTTFLGLAFKLAEEDALHLATHPCPREGGRVARWGTLRRRHSGA